MKNTQNRFFANKIHSPWLMWGVTISFVFFQFFLQLSVGVMINQLMSDFSITPFGAGILASGYYLIYTLMQTPAGVLVDRFGPRRLVGGGGLVCGLGCLVFAMSHSVVIAFAGRMLMGAGASFAFVSSLYLVAQWFHERRFAMMVGLAETMGMLGTIVGNVFLANLLKEISWRTTMFYSAGIAGLLGVLCYWIVRDKPENTHADTPHSPSMDQFYQDVKSVIKHGGLWLNGIYSGIIFCVVSAFAAFWALPFLMLYQHTTLPVATFESALIFAGIAFGSPIMGMLYRVIEDKRYFLSIAAILAALVSTWLIYFTPVSITATSLLFFILGVICSCYVFNYSIANHVVAKHVRSTSIGFTNTLCVVSAPILQPLIGYLLSLFSETGNVYSVQNYRDALFIIPVLLVLAAWIAKHLPDESRRSKV